MAREYLREARTFLVSGNLARAMELASRGLELMPDLPEAMGLVGRIARARGDTQLARSMLERWLASGADLPQAAEEARAYLSQ